MHFDMRIDKLHREKLMDHDAAEALAKTLNETEDACGWTYEVNRISPRLSCVVAYDEEGFMIAKL